MERDESERMRLTAALPVAIQSGWCAEEPVCATEAWQIKLRTDSLDAERRGTSHREKEKAENFSAVSASAVTTSSIIPLIIINYYQRTRGPFTSSSQRGREGIPAHSQSCCSLSVCVCVWASIFFVSANGFELISNRPSLGSDISECGIFGFFFFDCLCNAQVSQAFSAAPF